jgi:hypothetical protein
MIFNLIQYIRTAFPALTIISIGEDNSGNGTRITETGGEVAHDVDRKDHAIQFVTKNKDIVKAKQESESIFEYIKNVFNLTLPAVTVNAIIYSEIRLYRIVPIQSPGYIGADINGLHEYSFNVTITTT